MSLPGDPKLPRTTPHDYQSALDAGTFAKAVPIKLFRVKRKGNSYLGAKSQLRTSEMDFFGAPILVFIDITAFFYRIGFCKLVQYLKDLHKFSSTSAALWSIPLEVAWPTFAHTFPAARAVVHGCPAR